MGVKDQGIDVSRRRYQVIPRVLIFITHKDEVLLLKGAPTKRIWPNLYNGVGGHVERDESVLDAARREIAEEVGLEHVDNLRLRGIVNIATDDINTGIMMFVYTASSPTREVRGSSEGTLEWINPAHLSAEDCVADLPELIPRVLAMKDDDPPFFARYWYDEHDTLQMAFSTP
ncbi:MAG TPA: NUDIX domain-containing protein [Aggregatilineales bacterium]|nr:NUDIX domain-containing protein [Aggregatilineales bacterium]